MSLLKRIGDNGSPASSVGGAGSGTPPAVAGRLAAPGSLPTLSQTRPVPPPASREAEQLRMAELRKKVQERLVDSLDPRTDTNNQSVVRRQVEDILTAVLDGDGIVISRTERTRLLEVLLHDITGLGPLEELLADAGVSEIMVNGPKQIYVERRGRLEKVTTAFINDEHVMRIIERIIAPLGRRVDESSPMVDARLPDGSRVNVIIRPISLKGPAITIRKFARERLGVDDLIGFGTMTPEMAELLGACIKAKLNIVVSGGTGSGKTTTLNILSSFIPEDQRIVTIENAAELQLRQEHVVTLESRVASVEGRGEVSMMDLIVNSLRMRPDRIIVGECRAGEALAMLQAMNTGHDGSLTTLHANTPRDAVSRMETMCLMAGLDLPIRAIREQVASAVDLVVQQERLKDGSRKITYITEVLGIEGESVQLQDIFVFEQTGVDERGKIVGRLRPTGVKPRFVDKLEASGIYLPPGIFGTPDRFR
jgi:pilus assembly protein CpaF